MTTPRPHECEFSWYLEGANEYGWKCMVCRAGCTEFEPAGYNPRLDVERIYDKVSAILMDLHMAEVVYVSNGSMGEAVTHDVAQRCRAAGVYDQGSIVGFIVALVSGERHAKFWKEIGEGVRAGKDPRDRCACGKLSTVSQHQDGETKRWCSACFLKSSGGTPF